MELVLNATLITQMIRKVQKLVSSDALAVKSQGLNRRSSLKVVIGSKKVYCNLKEMVDIVEIV